MMGNVGKIDGRPRITSATSVTRTSLNSLERCGAVDCGEWYALNEACQELEYVVVYSIRCRRA